MIVNKALEELVKMPLLGAELAICLFIIRKTWGYKKTEDKISITQFEEGIKRSRPTIVKALKNLQLVNMVLLVNTDIKNGYCYRFNKKYKEWINAVKTPELVKGKYVNGKGVFQKSVKTALPKSVKPYEHTKEKRNKEIIQKKENTPSQNAKSFFKGVGDLKDKESSSEAEATKQFLQKLQEKYPDASKRTLWDEVVKFWSYWTELNATGRKERWEKQDAFQVERRLGTWFSKIKDFQSKEKPKSNYSPDKIH